MIHGKTSEIQCFQSMTKHASEIEKGENILTQGLCVQWIYKDVYMLLPPKSWSGCSCLQWPEKNVERKSTPLKKKYKVLPKTDLTNVSYPQNDKSIPHYSPSTSHLMIWPWRGCGLYVQHVCPLCLSFHHVLYTVSSHSQHPLKIRRKKQSQSVKLKLKWSALATVRRKLCSISLYLHLMMEQSLAAEKMHLSSGEITRQVIGSLCPLNTRISEASGGMIWNFENQLHLIC